MPEDSMVDIGRYQQYLEEKTSFSHLNPKTRSELNFDSLFEALDRTSSKVGKQYLYHMLASPKHNLDELLKFDRTVEQIGGDPRMRKKVQRVLKKLKSRNLYWLPAVILKPLLNEPRWFKIVPLLSLGMAVTLVSTIVFANMAWFLSAIGMLLLNTTIHWLHRNTIDIELRSIKQLGKLARAGVRLSELEIQSIDDAELKQSARVVSRISKWILSMSLEGNPYDPISMTAIFIMDNIKAMFFYDVIVFYFSLKQIRKHQREIHSVFKNVGYVDAAMSVGFVRASIGSSAPEFVDGQLEMNLQEACHPLVEGCVANSISMDKKGILITGSNMSGKTTFIKTVAVNALLAQTVYTTLTKSYHAPFLDIYASIGVVDDMTKGKSYYMAELEAIRVLVDASEGERPCLFIIDELFKGTNTLERVAAAKELLEYLARKNKHIVLMATHDIELASMLGNQYELYYFSEQVARDELEFDYRIKKGVLKTGNAIKLLRIVGFPESIVSAATDLSKRLEKGEWQ